MWWSSTLFFAHTLKSLILYVVYSTPSLLADISPLNLISPFSVYVLTFSRSWDDWVPQDRLRKFTEENLELAKNLKKEIDRVNQMSRSTGGRPTASTKSRKGPGSARPSEERSTPQQIAGKKRVRDADTERVSRIFPCPFRRLFPWQRSVATTSLFLTTISYRDLHQLQQSLRSLQNVAPIPTRHDAKAWPTIALVLSSSS
jgi:hypothetical protein